MNYEEQKDLSCDYGYELLMIISRLSDEISNLAYNIEKGKISGYGKIKVTLLYEDQK